MDTLMCQSATVRARIAGVLLFTALTAAAQTTPARIVPVTYINSTAAIKAFVGRQCGAVCTSSNARKVME